MVDTRYMKNYPVGLEMQASLKKTHSGKSKVKDGKLGIELPFGYCLVRGQVLRDMQKRLRTAEFRAKLRGRMVRQLIAEREKLL